ncbi:hypothetical protein K3495_g6824 [Podosphaera aphanis]|nr:hypothetical protein K3495_g6824 [Podosphaera aphanis]
MGLPPSQYMRAFPAVLRGIALSHYHFSNVAESTFEEEIHETRTLCEEENYCELAQAKWNEISLSSIIQENLSVTADCPNATYSPHYATRASLSNSRAQVELMSAKLAKGWRTYEGSTSGGTIPNRPGSIEIINDDLLSAYREQPVEGDAGVDNVDAMARGGRGQNVMEARSEPICNINRTQLSVPKFPFYRNKY